jgi:hypothetical protein
VRGADRSFDRLRMTGSGGQAQDDRLRMTGSG